MDNKKLISVVIPTCNRKERVTNCLKSIYRQTYRPIEIIVVNDGDVFENDFFDWIKKDESIIFKILENTINSGACISRNTGILHSKGYYLTLCDDDDEFTPDRLIEFVKEFNESNNQGLFSDTYISKHNKESRTFLPNIVTFNKILTGNYAGAQIFSTTSRMKNILFDRNFLASQDHDFNTRFIQKYGDLKKINGVTYISNHHNDGDRVSNNVLIGRLQYYLKYKKFMSLKCKIVVLGKIIVKAVL